MNVYHIALRHHKWTWVNERDVTTGDTLLRGVSLFDLPVDFVVTLMALIRDSAEEAG